MFVVFSLPFDVLNWLAKIRRYNIWNSLKIALHYIIKLGQVITNKGIFLDLFCNLKDDWSLVPGPVCFA